MISTLVAEPQRTHFIPGITPAPLNKARLYRDPDLGDIFAPDVMREMISLPGRPVRMRHGPGEVGVVVAVQKRPVFRCGVRSDQHKAAALLEPQRHLGCLVRFEHLWHSISHNERVDKGAFIQDVQCFGTNVTAFLAVAVANAALSKAQTDLSLGVITNHATTNEFTGSGLTRATGSLGSYTAPASLGATFSRVITKTFTASGSVTGKGSGLFNNTTVGSSDLYCEDNFSSDAVLVTSDTLTVNWTVTN